MLMHEVINTIQAIDNPLDGISPNFSAFGVEFNAWWKKLLGAAWAICLIAAIGYSLKGWVSMNQHQAGGHPSQVKEARADLRNGLISVAGLAAMPVIISAILTVAG